MVLTNSVFRGFLDCPARTMAEHGGLVTGDGRPADGICSDSARLNGEPCRIDKPVITGLLYATRGEYPAIGYQPVPLDMEAWETAVMLRLDAIRAVVAGDVPAPMCGRCDYCASRSRVQIADYSPSENPVIDDVFGINV